MPIGKTFYAAGISEASTGAEARAPRLPSSRIVAVLLATPGIGDFMRREAAWAGLVLVGLDPSVTEEQDWPTYSRMIANGMLQYKPISEFMAAGDRKDAKVWNSQALHSP